MGIGGRASGFAQTSSSPLKRLVDPTYGKPSMNLEDRIVIDPEIQHGKPVLRGTRLPVSRILGGLAGGMTFEDLRREYEISDAPIHASARPES